jgi:hypothetical protein
VRLDGVRLTGGDREVPAGTTTSSGATTPAISLGRSWPPAFVMPTTRPRHATHRQLGELAGINVPVIGQPRRAGRRWPTATGGLWFAAAVNANANPAI